MQDIPNYATFVRIEPIEKGWSGEKKYFIETRRGDKLLLRLADAGALGRKQLEFALMEQGYSFGVSMPRPVHVGLCQGDATAYSLFTWCDGEDAESVLPVLNEKTQYMLGVRAGEMLRTLHTIAAPKGGRAWGERFGEKVSRKIEQYRACQLKFPGDSHILRYVEENRNLLQGRPQSFQHGDYHVGNMVIDQGRHLSIIDFNRFDFGDPWEEFNRIVFSAGMSPKFATGTIDGYFGGRPPQLFFRLLAFYIASNTLSSIPWAIPFGKKEIETMQKLASDVLIWFNNMTNPVPTWYGQSAW